MKLITHFVRERYPYSENDMRGFFGALPQNTIDGIIKELVDANIVRRLKKNDKSQSWNDLADDLGGDDNTNDDCDVSYSFDFVGIVCVSGHIFKCYPKYLRHGITPLEELKQVIHVIEKASSKEETIKNYEYEQDTKANNRLSLMMFMLNDYYENGLYRNEIDTLEVNGDGEIDWDKTINGTYPLISSDQPYYVSMYTKKRVRDDSDFFCWLHACILTSICRELDSADLADLLDILKVELSEEELADFGDEDYVCRRIEGELHVQFNTRKQTLLKAMYDYIKQHSSLHDEGILTVYGTNSFHVIWEKVCAEVFDNVLDKPLSEVAVRLGITLSGRYRQNPSNKLSELMPKPEWSWPGIEKPIPIDDTLRLDLVSVSKNRFIIFDAKYYTPQINNKNKLSHIPGIADVTKQYFYQLAFMPFLMEHKISEIRNCFLMPMQYYKSDSGDFAGCGRAQIDIFHDGPLQDANMQDIQVRWLDPKVLYEYYLSGGKYTIEALNL